jgi:hypothetical protein|tara:strand:- start:5821 stop:6108 length:288 start_codon:yes stop_codon:yes gene_type:complete
MKSCPPKASSRDDRSSLFEDDILRRLLEWVEARDPFLVLREEEEEERKVLNLIVAEEVEEEEEEEEEEKEDFITIDLSPPPRSFPKMMTLCVRKK